MRNIIITLLLVFYSFSPAYAEDWYVAQNSNPTVMSEDGLWFVFLGRTKDGNLNVYITTRKFFECQTGGPSQGMYVNGVKVRFYQNCDPKMGMYWYAYTKEGTNYIIGEFMHKSNVTVQDGDLVMQFSAKGFNDTAREFMNEMANPGL